LKDKEAKKEMMKTVKLDIFKFDITFGNDAFETKVISHLM